MTSDRNAPLPRQPADRTFVAAMSALGAAALAQLVAAAVALVPLLRGDRLAAYFSATTRTETAPAPQHEASPAPDPAAPREIDTIVEAQQLIDQAYAFRSQGNYDAALQALARSDKLHPNEPITYFETAQTLSAAGKLKEAIDVLRRAQPLVAQATDPTYRSLRADIETLLGNLTGTAPGPADSPSSPPFQSSSGQPSAQMQEADVSRMRDEIGIPVGSTFGIIDCRLREGDPGYKVLQVATKAHPKEKIDRDRIQIAVSFYEKDESGEIVKTDAPLPNYWLDANTDWADGEPEVLEVKYRLPTSRDKSPAISYEGYVVGIYYKGELQDSRAEPAALAEQFPPKLSLSDTAQ